MRADIDEGYGSGEGHGDVAFVVGFPGGNVDVEGAHDGAVDVLGDGVFVIGEVEADAALVGGGFTAEVVVDFHDDIGALEEGDAEAVGELVGLRAGGPAAEGVCVVV